MSENGISFPDLPIVYIFFTKPLSKKDFDYLVSKLDEYFGICGNPIELGDTKIHIYGVDKSTWKPIFIDFTDRHIVAVIPNERYCDIINNLINNVRKYIDQEAKVYKKGGVKC